MFASVVFVLMFVLGINLLREKKPEWVPGALKSWKWLPAPLRSLEPYDNFFSRLACCRKLKNKSHDGPNNDAATAVPIAQVSWVESNHRHQTIRR